MTEDDFCKLRWGNEFYPIYGSIQDPLMSFGDYCKATHLDKQTLPKHYQVLTDDDMIMLPCPCVNVAIPSEHNIQFGTDYKFNLSPNTLVASALLRKYVNENTYSTVTTKDKEWFKQVSALMLQHPNVVDSKYFFDFVEQIGDIFDNATDDAFKDFTSAEACDFAEQIFRPLLYLDLGTEERNGATVHIIDTLYYYHPLTIDQMTELVCDYACGWHFIGFISSFKCGIFTFAPKDIVLIFRLLQSIDLSKFKEMSNKLPQQHKAHTYLMKDTATGMTKIGRSIHPAKRERTLQADKPTIELLYTTPENIESKLHKEFDAFRVRGEWFNLTQEQIEYIVKTYKFKKIHKDK